MAYSLTISIALGTGQAGLTLNAQIITSAGVNVGSVITTGFTEIGNGNYLWTYNAFSDGFVGGVVFSTADTVMAVASVNPPTSDIGNIVIDSDITLRQMLAIMAATLAGKVTGADTNTIEFSAIDGTETRITATVDSYGNRSSVTLNPPN